MRAGRVVQTGAPREVHKTPADAWTARFLGHPNLVSPAEAARLGLPCPPGHRLLVPEGAIRLVAAESAGARPRPRPPVHLRGALDPAHARLDGVKLEAEAGADLRPGARVGVALEPGRARPVPDPEGGRR
jgi:putative spermidine/putrescine transport system ATP-binding protein